MWRSLLFAFTLCYNISAAHTLQRHMGQTAVEHAGGGSTACALRAR